MALNHSNCKGSPLSLSLNLSPSSPQGDAGVPGLNGKPGKQGVVVSNAHRVALH